LREEERKKKSLTNKQTRKILKIKEKQLNKQTNKFENLSDFQQIQGQFYQLFATVLR